MKKRATVGDREFELLRWIENAGGASVGEAAEGYGLDQGLARSTVLTMMERLRQKGNLRRRAVDGVFRYQVAEPAGDVARRAVANFVSATLGGSLSPFVAYLVEHESLDEAQVDELEALVDRLRDRRRGESS